MKSREQESVDQLNRVVSEIRNENRAFQATIQELVTAINNKVEAKHIPLSLEQEVINTSRDAIREALQKSLSNQYNSPMTKYAENVITKYKDSIEGIFDTIIKEGIQTQTFKVQANEVLMSKIAKTLISGIDGSVDKTINAMKQDPVFRSRLTLAVNNLIEEFIAPKI